MGYLERRRQVAGRSVARYTGVHSRIARCGRRAQLQVGTARRRVGAAVGNLHGATPAVNAATAPAGTDPAAGRRAADPNARRRGRGGRRTRTIYQSPSNICNIFSAPEEPIAITNRGNAGRPGATGRPARLQSMLQSRYDRGYPVGSVFYAVPGSIRHRVKTKPGCRGRVATPSSIIYSS